MPTPDIRTEKDFPFAVLYQAQKPPLVNGVVKPMKPGGSSDSGADIAYALIIKGYKVITPVENPNIRKDMDWVFPDTGEGIKAAMEKGAITFWLNTVLFSGHPIEKFFSKGIYLVGQEPAKLDIGDDKWTTQQLLKEQGLAIPDASMVTADREKALGFVFSSNCEAHSG